MEDKTAFLISAPRSGNTWLRYILEYIFERQTVGYAHHQGDGATRELVRIWEENIPIEQLRTNHVLLDVPVFSLVRWGGLRRGDPRWKAMFGSTPIIKKHSFEDQIDFMFLFRKGIDFDYHCQQLIKKLKQTGYPYSRMSTSCKVNHLLKTSNQHKLIILIRNYKEYLTRVLSSKNFYVDETSKEFSKEFLYEAKQWMKIIRAYHEYAGPKVLVSYEKLMLSPKAVAEQLQDFMGNIARSSYRFTKFFNDYESHKQKSISFYKNTNGGESLTKGAQDIVHSSQLSETEKRDIDNLMKSIDEEMYEKYAKIYSEE